MNEVELECNLLRKNREQKQNKRRGKNTIRSKNVFKKLKRKDMRVQGDKVREKILKKGQQ